MWQIPRDLLQRAVVEDRSNPDFGILKQLQYLLKTQNPNENVDGDFKSPYDFVQKLSEANAIVILDEHGHTFKFQRDEDAGYC